MRYDKKADIADKKADILTDTTDILRLLRPISEIPPFVSFGTLVRRQSPTSERAVCATRKVGIVFLSLCYPKFCPRPCRILPHEPLSVTKEDLGAGG